MSTDRLWGALALALAACSAQRAKDPLAGNVQIKLAAQGRTLDAAAGPPAVCATFTLTPYALGAGGAQSQAGAPISFASTAGGIAPILGCVHTPGLAPDWRYLATATNFVDCASQQAIPDLTPSIESFTVDVNCTPGQDVAAQVTATVSIPVANSGGYLDIGVGINVNTPQSGCKVADIDSSGFLHFGQSYVQTIGGPAPSAYTAIGTFTPPAMAGVAANAGAVQQFVGSVNSNGQADAFFTGLYQLPAAPQTTSLLQAFAKPCAGQMTIQPSAVECSTQATLPASVATQVQIADVFVDWPGRGSVSASIAGSSGIALSTSLRGPHLGTVTPAITGYDDLTHLQALSLAPLTAIGLYGSLLHSDELLALAQDPVAGAQVIALTLDEVSGLWSAATPAPLSSFTLAQQQAMGLFGPGGCFTEPLPACTPGPVAQACTPTANGVPVPAPQGATVTPTNAGCSATTYSPDFYFQFNPSAPAFDSTGNGRDMVGFNGNPLPPVTAGPAPGGGYLASSALNYYEFFYLASAGSAAAAPHGATMEMLLRFGPDGAIGAPGAPRYGYTSIMNLGTAIFGGADGADIVAFTLYSYGTVGFATRIGVIDASADGATTKLGTAAFTFDMSGFNGRSWSSLTDGKFHHFALIIDLDHEQIALSIDGKVEDGWAQPFPSALALTGLDHHLHIQPVDAGAVSWGFNGEGFRGDIDELAWTPAVLPQTLLAQHAAQAAADQHYSFTDQCQAPPPVPPSTDNRVVPTDFAPTVDGTQPPVNPWPQYLNSGGTSLATAVPTQLASQQLQTFPLPRYAQGNAVPRMDHWLDPTYYAWIPEFEADRAGALAERGAAQIELARDWNFHTYVQTSSTPSPWDIVATEGGHSITWHMFLVAANVDLSGIPNSTYSGQYTRAAAGGFRLAGASKGQVALDSYNAALASGHRAPFVVQDALFVEDGETLGFSQYDYAWISGSPDLAYFNSTYDTGGACASAPASAACTQAVARFQGDTVSLFRQSYYDGIASVLPPATFPRVRFTWYNLDGYAGYQAMPWGDHGRDAAETQPGQSFQPAGFVQHLSGSDEYIVTPEHWSILGRAGNDDLGWLDVSRPSEEAAGDFLMAPYLSAGWNNAAESDVRPPQMLSLAKYLVAAGAISFHPGVFATSIQGPSGVRLAYGRYPDHPGDAREYIWQAAVASYAQAIASRVESRMRASKIVWQSDDSGGTHIFHEAGNPGNLAAVRQEYDPANQPLQRFLISAGVEGFKNGIGPQWRRSDNISFELTQGGPKIKVPARRQGSFYSLDLDGPSPVLVQYDGWHEDAAFNYWAHDFVFEAEAADGRKAGSGAQLIPATEAPGLASFDFTNFTSFLTVQSPGPQTWSLAQNALAPRASYLFEPRSAWGTTTWFVWVRARNHGAGAAPVYVGLDQQPVMKLGCVSGTDWQWVRTDLISGQPATLAGVAVDQQHTLWVAPGSSTVDIDQIKLVAEADHAECPLTATCGCGQ
jgi:hypothetical protein